MHYPLINTTTGFLCYYISESSLGHCSVLRRGAVEQVLVFLLLSSYKKTHVTHTSQLFIAMYLMRYTYSYLRFNAAGIDVHCAYLCCFRHRYRATAILLLLYNHCTRNKHASLTHYMSGALGVKLSVLLFLSLPTAMICPVRPTPPIGFSRLTLAKPARPTPQTT